MRFLILILFVFSLVSCGGDPRPKPKPRDFEYDPVVKTFHLNYSDSTTNPKDWTQCGKNDFVVFDMFESTQSEFDRCERDGAQMICYFSSQYENWRPDKGQFRSADLGKSLDGWAGERWVNIKSARIRDIMKARMDFAADRGCFAVDVDNVDVYLHQTGFDLDEEDAIDYILFLAEEAHSRGMDFSLKNSTEIISETYDYVDMYQNEQCQRYNECHVYDGLGKPVFNIEYKDRYCNPIPYMYSVRKDVERMHAWFEVCQ